MLLEELFYKELSLFFNNINFSLLKNETEKFWGQLDHSINDIDIVEESNINCFGLYNNKEQKIYINIYKISSEIGNIIYRYLISPKKVNANDKFISFILQCYVEAVLGHELYHAYLHKKLGSEYNNYKIESEVLSYSKKIYEIEADENMIRYLENKDVLKGKIGELAKLVRERYSGDIKEELVKIKINNILEMRLGAM